MQQKKGEKYFLWHYVATPNRKLFDIYTKKPP